jgi:NitT/TauT family transport system ATP-binding protein
MRPNEQRSIDVGVSADGTVAPPRPLRAGGAAALPDPTANKVHIRGLHKIYASGTKRVIALEDVNLDIRQNEFVTLVGPSGCGKSTLLKLIGALIRPSRGMLLFDGKPLLGPTRDVGIVFQEAVLLEWRTALDNVLLPAEILGLDRARARERALGLIDLVGLSGFEKCYPRELSGGMQQRVSICRALIHNPSVLLMDEPFAALDALTREELGFELMRIWDTEKKTVIFVTHNITEAILLADRVVAMSPRPGRIAKIVSVDLPRPRTLDMEFTQEFKDYSEQIREVIYHGPGGTKHDR